ncbi:G-type lectin S-receptor-like serine/threonine-protein kinase LECRK2 [Neltuma alba]|uniref:G-type lectin S-receptor-like serine/threonine-protein kinase LECRK2 n=1 Tax=Neltuma alba TaxID=207710 RepID=UPI0010A46BCD|nr:G-type lectin S-receptor-like serine/threonine-protein kinase LECRK2 [Prosopis alba]
MANVASNIYFLLLLSFLCERYEIASAKIIELGDSLSPTIPHPSWPSPSGRFAFGFYQQGNGFKVGIWLFGNITDTIVWTANRDDPPVSSNATLVLTKNGELVLQTGQGRNSPIASILEPANSASMLDSGNFVLYGRNHRVIWQSFDFPTNTILGGQNLSTKHGLLSDLSESNHSSGHFVLKMQDDGNLVAYPLNSERSDDAFWASNTLDTTISQLTLNLSGSLCLGNDTNLIKVIIAPSKHVGKNTSLIYRATLDVDGNFRLYVHTSEKNGRFTSQIVWQAISDHCQVNGFCGLNSYCSIVTGKAECKCYPGFKPINANNNMFLVCEQTIKNDCITSKDPRMLYNISNPLQHMEWSLVPYLVISLEMEACGKSCQEDCDCAAVLHEAGICKKYKLPLRFGRINQNTSATALFKLPSGIAITTTPNPRSPLVQVDHKKNLILTLIFTLGSISFVCLVIAMSIFFIYKRQVHSYRKLSASTNLGFTEDCSLRIFSFDELVNSTGNFTEEVGRGSFGVVYKGIIRGSNRRIIVKKLDIVVDEGEKEFQAEITAIARTHHRNLVQLIGYCNDGSRKLLVYEYMSNGSLADFLFKAEMHLSWKQRVKIALDVARGILYLHEECEVCIIHCNIKPQNILLDEMWTAKISDFGLARLSMPGHSIMALTSGYIAPERQKDALATVKVDIYSYGVVLLEIICCRRNIDVKVSSEEEIMLSSWVYNCFVRGELNKLVVDEDVEWRTFERMVKVALWCVQEDLSSRPSMRKVLLMLEGLKDIPIPPSPSLFV